MPSLKELRESAGAVVKTMHEIRDRYNERKTAGKTGAELWPENERTAWDEANATYATLKTQIDEEKRASDLDTIIAEAERTGQLPGTPPAPPGESRGTPPPQLTGEQLIEERDLAVQAWAGYRSPACRTERHLQAAQRCGIDPSADQLVLDLYDSRSFTTMQAEYRLTHPTLLQQRALSANTGSIGGFLIGSTLVSSLERNMLAFGGIEQVADVIVTQTGEEISWPTADDTTNEGEIIGENPGTPNEAEPSMALVKWGAYEFSSKLIKVPVRLLEDAPSYLADALGSMLGERIGRAKNRKFTTGTGNSQPKGLVTCAASGGTTASSTAITYDELIRLEHSIDPAYRDDPSCCYMMHDNIILEVRLLKDGGSRYIWQPGLMQGTTDRLNGRRVVVNQHMASALASANKTVLFGKMSAYKVRRVRQLVLLRLKERFAETRQEGFIAFERADGNLLNAGTAPVKYLAQKT
jgi:HK97 family phage major capsid protein